MTLAKSLIPRPCPWPCAWPWPRPRPRPWQQLSHYYIYVYSIHMYTLWYINIIYIYTYLYGINENRNLMLTTVCVRRFFALLFGCKSVWAEKDRLKLQKTTPGAWSGSWTASQFCFNNIIYIYGYPNYVWWGWSNHRMQSYSNTQGRRG